MAALFRQGLKRVVKRRNDDALLSVPLADGLTVTCRVKRSTRRRRTIAICMGADGLLVVAAPARASLALVHAFLVSKSRWVLQAVARHEASDLPTRYTDGTALSYLGSACRLTVLQGHSGCQLHPHRFVVSLPTLTASQAEQDQMTKLELRLWLKRRARQKLMARLALWEERLGIQTGNFSISDARQRWGSCDAGNHIRLNWRLIMTPLRVIDYVCVHELCHVQHKNHGVRFWHAVGQAMPDYAERERELKQCSALLAAF